MLLLFRNASLFDDMALVYMCLTKTIHVYINLDSYFRFSLLSEDNDGAADKALKGRTTVLRSL